MGKKDITLKDYFADRNRYADLLNGSLFNGQQIIKSEELQDTDTVQSKSDNRAARACEIIGVTIEEYQRAKDYDYAAAGDSK